MKFHFMWNRTKFKKISNEIDVICTTKLLKDYKKPPNYIGGFLFAQATISCVK
jgi:hypothetical protein